MEKAMEMYVSRRVIPGLKAMMTLEDVSAVVYDAIVAGMAVAMREVSPRGDEVSQAEAYRLYGRQNVERWVEAGHLKHLTRTGNARNSKKVFSRAEIARVKLEDSMWQRGRERWELSRLEERVQGTGNRVQETGDRGQGAGN